MDNNNEEMDDFLNSLSKDPVGEFEQNEMLNTARENFGKRLSENKEAQKLYNETVNAIGVKIMFQTLTKFKYSYEENAFTTLASKIGFEMNESMIQQLIDESKKHPRMINPNLIMAFAIANKGQCKNKTIESFLVSKFDEIKNFFAEQGEFSYMAFCSNLILSEHFVDEMTLKEKVYSEVAELESTPIPEK